jgi:hypothetical protein
MTRAEVGRGAVLGLLTTLALFVGAAGGRFAAMIAAALMRPRDDGPLAALGLLNASTLGAAMGAATIAVPIVIVLAADERRSLARAIVSVVVVMSFTGVAFFGVVLSPMPLSERGHDGGVATMRPVTSEE